MGHNIKLFKKNKILQLVNIFIFNERNVQRFSITYTKQILVSAYHMQYIKSLYPYNLCAYDWSLWLPNYIQRRTGDGRECSHCWKCTLLKICSMRLSRRLSHSLCSSASAPAKHSRNRSFHRIASNRRSHRYITWTISFIFRPMSRLDVA